jgi:ubiquinone/menaquinone biosynthesis C-methylase UbiE
MNETPLYDAFSGDYDRFVNWQRRLGHDLPFLTEELEHAEAQRVLDVACGTGWHSIALSQRGYDVVGSDISARMIERAQQNASREGAPTRFVHAGFGQLVRHVDESFGGLLCMGNSLPHVSDAQALRETLLDFSEVLRPGGVLIIQQRNFDQVWSEQQRFMPLETYSEDGEEWLFFRFYDFKDATIAFNMVIMRQDEGVWDYHVESTQLWPIFKDHLVEQLQSVGFDDITCYGNLRRVPFDPDRSGNLVVVARRGA